MRPFRASAPTTSLALSSSLSCSLVPNARRIQPGVTRDGDHLPRVLVSCSFFPSPAPRHHACTPITRFWKRHLGTTIPHEAPHRGDRRVLVRHWHPRTPGRWTRDYTAVRPRSPFGAPCEGYTEPVGFLWCIETGKRNNDQRARAELKGGMTLLRTSS